MTDDQLSAVTALVPATTAPADRLSGVTALVPSTVVPSDQLSAVTVLVPSTTTAARRLSSMVILVPVATAALAQPWTDFETLAPHVGITSGPAATASFPPTMDPPAGVDEADVKLFSETYPDPTLVDGVPQNWMPDA